MEKHFVTFYSPGTLVHEETIFPIDGWNVDKACRLARKVRERHGATPFAFRFSTRKRGDKDLDSYQDCASGTYFLGGKLLSLSEIIERNSPDDATLISNMRNNRIKMVVENTNSYKVVIPYERGDTIIPYRADDHLLRNPS